MAFRSFGLWGVGRWIVGYPAARHIWTPESTFGDRGVFLTFEDTAMLYLVPAQNLYGALAPSWVENNHPLEELTFCTPPSELNSCEVRFNLKVPYKQ